MKISLFYDHVTVLDFAYLDHHRGVVGHSLAVDVEFIGTTDDEGVVFDFSLAKNKVKEIIDRDCDHRLVIPRSIQTKNNDNEFSFHFSYGFNEACLEYRGPQQALCVIPNEMVTLENLKTYLEGQVYKEMPETVDAVRLNFREEKLTENDSFFHYSHGLKDHYGNCQRLLHGHRSSIKIFINDKRDHELEKYFCQSLFSSNIHFCFWENVLNKEEIIELTGSQEPVGRFSELPFVEIQYRGNQGEFYGKLPGHEVYLMPLESTVENLSIHFAQVVKEMVNETDRVSVYAYEGIAKGAITTL